MAPRLSSAVAAAALLLNAPAIVGASFSAAAATEFVVLPGTNSDLREMLPSTDRTITLQGTRLGAPSAEQAARRQLENVVGEATGFRVLTPSGAQGCSDADDCKVAGEYVHAEALFGVPPYGGAKMIVGALHYVTPETNDNGCDEASYKVDYVDKEAGDVVYLVDRGVCHFVDKVRIGELKGAAAVVISDNNCMCTDMGPGVHTEKFQALCEAAVQAASPPQCERTLPFMADDGSGGDISIPSFLVTMWEAQRLKDCYNTARGRITASESVTGIVCKPDQPITVQLQWDMPNPDGNVEWDLWTNSDDSTSFKSSFQSSSQLLAPSTTFTPHYFIWDGERWGCLTEDQKCSTQCTHGGRYCSIDPDQNLAQGVSGADVVNENLRQLCVWDQAKETVKTDGGAMWWDYVNIFAKECHGADVADPSTFTETCSKAVHAKVGLSWSATLKCMADSNVPAGCDPSAGDCMTNTLLQAELSSRTEKSILMLPTVVVNNVIERGGVTPVAVLSTICSGFVQGSEPDLCSCIETHSKEDVLLCASSQCPTTERPFYCTYNSLCTQTEESCLEELVKAVEGANARYSVEGTTTVSGADLTTDVAKATFTAALRKSLGEDIVPSYSTFTTSFASDGGGFVTFTIIFKGKTAKAQANVVASIFAKNVDMAITDLVAELEANGGSDFSGVTVVFGTPVVRNTTPATPTVDASSATGVAVAVALSVVCVFGAAGFVYWRRAKAQMRAEVRNILAEYMPLEEIPADATKRGGFVGEGGAPVGANGSDQVGHELGAI